MIYVTYFPHQAHCFAFGGFELQMLTAFDAIDKNFKLEVAIKKIDVWNRNQSFDIAHFWGLELSNFSNIVWAKRSGKRVVLTVLLSYYDRPFSKLKHAVSRRFYSAKLLIEMLKYVDALVVVNEQQKLIATSMFNFEKSRVHVVPNIIHDAFFTNFYSGDIDEPPFVLTVGNVCKRKNQVRLAEACKLINRRLVIVGREMPGEEAYSNELENLVNSSELLTWIKGLPSSSKELITLVKSCFLFALPSEAETQPISLLEAASCGKPLLISNLSYARQDFYKNACLVNPNSIESIAKGIDLIFDNVASFIAPQDILDSCRSTRVARCYYDIYREVMNEYMNK